MVVTKGARENLVEKGIDKKKITILPHWTDEKIFQSVDQREIELIRDTYKFEEKFVIMFAGNLRTVQGLDTIVSAAVLLKDYEKILVVFVGGGSDEYRLKDPAIFKP